MVYKYVKSELIAEVKRAIENMIARYSNDPENKEMDIRLQLYEGDSYTYIGDIQNDPDSRGVWSYGTVVFEDGFDVDYLAENIVKQICELLPDDSKMLAFDRDELENAIAILVEGIRTYECDFWSSPSEKVTTKEARIAAANLIHQWMFNEDGIPQKVDGSIVENLILSIREETEEVGFIVPSTEFLDVYEG